jgi:hypothetical protein
MIDGMRAKPSKKMDNIGPMPIFVKLEKMGQSVNFDVSLLIFHDYY